MTEIEQLAIHEAGHAVAHYRLDIDQSRASIELDEEAGTAGRVIGSDFFLDEDGAKDQILALLAGYGATIAAGVSHELAVQGCDGGENSDFALARSILEKFPELGNFDEWLVESADLMKDPRNISAVARVAQELEEHQRIDYDDIDFCILIADGEHTEEEYEKFKVNREYFLKAERERFQDRS